MLEAHFQLGLFFKEEVIPRAYLYFTRAGLDSEMNRSGSKVKLKRSSRIITSSGLKTPVRKVSDDTEEKDRKIFPKEMVNGIVNEIGGSKLIADHKEDGFDKKTKQNGHVKPPVESTQNTVVQENYSTEIAKSVLEDNKDPLPGRYLMESSENFDDFMKALGVGMIKRKLANSVIPVNEIEIAEDGQYTIRTVTTVRTTEINFKLNEPFIEDTIDGRKTQTIPTRDGNLLKLDQKGDKSKGEKDSVMTRDLVGDVITMKLIVDNVVCTRIYKRIDGKGDFITTEVPKMIKKEMTKNKPSVKGPSSKPSEMENNTNEDEYEDIESDLENDETEKNKDNKRRRKRMDLKSQPLQVQRNVKALKRLLYQQKKMESDMYKDIHKLEGYFYKIHQSKIYNERLKQVEGVLNQSTIIEEDENDEDNPSSEMQEPGIPGFWLRVFLNSKNLSQIVQVRGCRLPLFHLYFINIFFQFRQQTFLF